MSNQTLTVSFFILLFSLFPTPDATGRERVRGRVSVRAVKITAIEVVIALRDRTPKVVRDAITIGRPLAAGTQVVALRRSVTAASVVTRLEVFYRKYHMDRYPLLF